MSSENKLSVSNLVNSVHGLTLENKELCAKLDELRP